jgi:mono/diheme cytochrome c family protein
MAYPGNFTKIAQVVVFASFAFCCASLVSAGDVFNGKAVYTDYCQGCHGRTGRGEMPGTPNFSRGGTMMKPDLALYRQIANGRNAMPGFLGVLSEQEILDVVSYIRTLY